MKKTAASLMVILIFFLFAKIALAQEGQVDYKGEVIVDSDLDGLTDKGEEQIYSTNPGNPDSDGDGYLDGAEILSGADPTSVGSYPGKIDIAQAVAVVSDKTPWVWYIVRASGLLGFIFLWLTIFLGLAIRNPLLKKIIDPFYSLDLHCFTAAVAIFWVLVHATSLLFDPMIGFGIKDISIPYFSQSAAVDTNYMALGIMAFYMMAIMTVTSYLRRHISHRLWRVLHFLNPLAFIFVVSHGYHNGTDMENVYIAGAY
ncbi:MAG: ferric reductase-like transmembrane domain-containing protein, partial [Candidatus Moranbacteria bacterium]|nr:ferric reductase-like transmembrane domain-containing protein [Candidatus Moranbacteria bacterium]